MTNTINVVFVSEWQRTQFCVCTSIQSNHRDNYNHVAATRESGNLRVHIWNAIAFVIGLLPSSHVDVSYSEMDKRRKYHTLLRMLWGGTRD